MRKTNRFWKRWISIVSGTLLCALLLTGFVAVSPVYADEGGDPNLEKHGEQIDERLEACYDKLNEWYDIQDANIGKANNAIQRVEELFDKAAELGIDTSAIQDLMPGLYAAVGQAEYSHEQADQILSEHAGFNGSGKVMDRQLAWETCKSARDALAEAKDSLLEARDIVQEIITIARELRQNYVPTSDVSS